MKGSLSFLIAVSFATSAALAQTDDRTTHVPEDVLDALGLGDLLGAADDEATANGPSATGAASAVNESAVTTAGTAQTPPVLAATNEDRPAAADQGDDLRMQLPPVDVRSTSSVDRAIDAVLHGIRTAQLMAAQANLLPFIGTEPSLGNTILDPPRATDVEALREAAVAARRDLTAKRDAAAVAMRDAEARRQEALAAARLAEERQQAADAAERQAARLTSSLTAAEDERRQADAAARLAADALSRIRTDASAD